MPKPRQQTEPQRTKKVTADWLERAGLYYLGRFSASEAHFRTVMMRKIQRRLPDGCDVQALHHDWLDALVEKLKRYDYLNDATYGEARMRALRARGKPLRRIRDDLRHKGVPDDMIANLLNELDDGEGHPDLRAAVRYIERRRFGAFARAGSEKPYDKQLAAMARAGFSYDIARAVLDADDPHGLLEDQTLS